MAIFNNGEFTGVPQQRFSAEEPVKAADLRMMAQDQSHVYERLTGLDADGAGVASTNSVHDHASETGNKLALPIATWQHGTRGPNGDGFEGNSVVEAYAGALTFNGSYSTERDICAFPFFVSDAWAFDDLLFIISANRLPSVNIYIYDSSNTLVAGPKLLTSASNVAADSELGASVLRQSTGEIGPSFGAVFQTGGSGVFYAVMRINALGGDETRSFYGGAIIPLVKPIGAIVDPPTPSITGDDTVDVGDPDASNAWQPIDEALIPTADGALHAVIGCKLAENNALLYEVATGLPAPGNAAMTVALGHAHTGASGDGPEIERNLVTGVLSGSPLDLTSIGTGSRLRAPKTTATSGADSTAAQGAVYMPRSSFNTAGSSKTRFAALIYTDQKSSNSIRVTATFGSTTRSYDSAAGGVSGGYELITTPISSTNSFSFTANAINEFIVEAQANALGGSSPNVLLMGFCFYVEA